MMKCTSPCVCAVLLHRGRQAAADRAAHEERRARGEDLRPPAQDQRGDLRPAVRLQCGRACHRGHQGLLQAAGEPAQVHHGGEG